MSLSFDSKPFTLGTTNVGVAILPLPPQTSLPTSISGTDTITKSRAKQKGKEKEYVERKMVIKAENKSYSSLVHPLPRPGFKKEAQKCMGILKVDGDGKVSFDFCYQRQDFRQDIEFLQTKKDIYEEQAELQMRKLDGRRKNDIFAGYNFGSDDEEDKTDKKKIPRKKKADSDDGDVQFGNAGDSD